MPQRLHEQFFAAPVNRHKRLNYDNKYCFTFRSGCKAPPVIPVSDAKTSPAPEIDPVLKAFGRHIARSFHRGRGIHIPAMKNTAFGQCSAHSN